MSRKTREWKSPEQVSDIHITRTFQVECPDHGVIDERPTFSAAVQSRRVHWERDCHGLRP